MVCVPPVFVITTVRAVSKVQETVPFLPRSSVKATPARDAVRSRSFLLLSPPACPLRADACDISACPDRTEQPNDSSLIFGASVVKTRKRKKRPIVTLGFECPDNVNGSSGICDRPLRLIKIACSGDGVYFSAFTYALLALILQPPVSSAAH